MGALSRKKNVDTFYLLPLFYITVAEIEGLIEHKNLNFRVVVNVRCIYRSTWNKKYHNHISSYTFIHILNAKDVVKFCYLLRKLILIIIIKWF